MAAVDDPKQEVLVEEVAETPPQTAYATTPAAIEKDDVPVDLEKPDSVVFFAEEENK